MALRLCVQFSILRRGDSLTNQDRDLQCIDSGKPIWSHRRDCCSPRVPHPHRWQVRHPKGKDGIATEGKGCKEWEWKNYIYISCVQLFATPWTVALQASLSFTISWSLLKLMSIESVMPSNHLNLCHPLFLLSSVFPSIRVFSNELALCIRWPKYWIFSFSISPSNEYSGLISFRTDFLNVCVCVSIVQNMFRKPFYFSKWKVIVRAIKLIKPGPLKSF